MYVLRVEVYPKVGHGHEVQSALEEWVRGRQGKQPSFMLTRRVLSSEGFALAVTSRYQDLSPAAIKTWPSTSGWPGRSRLTRGSARRWARSKG